MIATLLLAAFAAATARAQEVTSPEPPAEATPVAPPPADTTTAPAAPTVPDLGTGASAPSEAPPPEQPANSPGTTPDPSPSDSATTTDPPPSSQDTDHSAARQPARDAGSAGQGSTGQGSPGPAAPSVAANGAGSDTVPPRSDGYPGDWSGQDIFVLDDEKNRDAGSATAFGGQRGPLVGLFVLRAESRAGELVVKARRGHEVAKATPIGGPPGSGGQLPGQNPFFNFMSGPGGSAAGLALASILAILGGALLLPRDRSRRFRMPTVKWRPLAYVPPIELPG